MSPAVLRQRLVAELRSWPLGQALVVEALAATALQRLVSGLRSCPGLQAVGLLAVDAVVVLSRQRLVSGLRVWLAAQGTAAVVLTETTLPAARSFPTIHFYRPETRSESLGPSHDVRVFRFPHAPSR